MDPSSISSLVIALTILSLLLLLVVAAFFSAVETAVAAMPPGRLQQLADEGHKKAASLLVLTEQRGRFLATAKVGITAAILFANTIVIWQFGPWLALLLGGSRWASALSLTVIVSLLVILLAQYGPRIAANQVAEPLALACTRPLRVFTWALWPVVVALDGLTRALLRPLGLANGLNSLPTITEAELRLQVTAAEAEGVLDEAEREMIHSIFEFGDTLVREIMVPRLDVVAANVDRPVAEVLDLALAAGHSRTPVFEEDIDHILGIFYVKDAMLSLRQSGETVALRQLLRPVHFVPETKKVEELLREMRQSKAHMAIVVDEYGGTAGVVTIEDILEEIVGEIQDEFDVDEEIPIRRLSDQEAVVDALTTLHQVNEILALQLHAEDVDTLGGYVYDRLGRVPVLGDEVVEDGIRLIVEVVEGNRIKKIRVHKEPPTPGSSDVAPTTPAN